jgi:hypothetical protein
MTSLRAITTMTALEAMDRAGIGHCVLRNHEEIPIEPGRDVDLVVRPEHLDDVEHILTRTALELGWSTLARCDGHHEGTSFYFLQNSDSLGVVRQLELHFTRVRWAGATILSAGDLVADRVMTNEGIWVAAPHHTAVQRIMHYGLSGQLASMKDGYWRELVAVTRADPDSVTRALERIVADRGAIESVVDAILGDDRSAASGLTHRLRRGFLASGYGFARARELHSMIGYTAGRLGEPLRPVRCGVVAIVPRSATASDVDTLTGRVGAVFLETIVIDANRAALADRRQDVIRVVNRAGLAVIRSDDPSTHTHWRWRGVACSVDRAAELDAVMTVKRRFEANHTLLVAV